MPRNGIRTFAFIGLVTVLLIGAFALNRQYGASSVTLAPHRGLYKLQTTAIRNTTSIANVRGDMFYEWHQSCDSWTTNQKFHMEFLYPEGEPATLNSTYSTVESRDGRNFHFSTQRERNAQEAEEVRGDARKSGLGGGSIHFSKPEEAGMALAAAAKFPTAHTRALLEAAKRGDLLFNAPLFDGSETDPPVDVNGYIGKAQTYAGEADNLKTNPLLQSPLHKVRLAFFSNKIEDEPVLRKKSREDEISEVPDYEMTLMIHENGVVSEYQIDYPDFSLTASLEALDPLPDECP